MIVDKEQYKKEFKRRLYNFVLKIIEFIDKLPKDHVGYVVSDQLLRSSTSILGNYIEGQSASSKRDYLKYFEISLKSINESKLWLALLRDSKRTTENIDWFLQELKEFGNIFGSSVLTLKGKRNI